MKKKWYVMENKTFDLFIILLCRIFSNSSSIFMWTANTCAMNSQACRSEKGTFLGLICWQTMRPERIKMPKRGVNWAFLKLIVRIKSYKPNFTPSVY
jgi:hypothetical protein